MISATRRWFRRNRGGIAIAAGVVGATYLAGQYVIGKISEARERFASDRLAREKYTGPRHPICSESLTRHSLRRRFEQNQSDCTFTVLALLPNLTENILDALRVEQLTNELQQKKAERLARLGGDGTPSDFSSGPPSIRDGADTASLSSFQSSSYLHTSQLAESESGPARPRKTKAQLWNEIKIFSITRSFTFLYTLSLLTLLTRIQLNLLGRLNYLSSVISLTRPSPPERAHSISLEDNDGPGSPGGPTFGNDFETNRRYLAFTWFLLNKGYANLLSEIQAAVTEVFGAISPTEAITAARLSDLTLQVRQKIEGSTSEERRSKNWLTYLLPPREEEDDLLIESGVLTPPQSHSSTSPPSPNPSSAPDISHQPHSSLQNPHNPLRKLIDETADLIESPTFTRIHTLLLNSLFSHLIEHKVVDQAFPPPRQPPQQPPSSPPLNPHRIPPTLSTLSTVTVIATNPTHHDPRSTSEPTTKLANILAVLTRQAHAIGNGNNPNEYVQVMEREVRELEAFAAVIYSSQLMAEETETEAEAEAEAAEGYHVAQGSKGDEPDDIGVQGLLESAWNRVLGPTSPSGAPRH